MNAFPLPKRLHTDSGNIRRVGVELEFAGLELDQISRLIIELFGGHEEQKSRFERVIRGTRWGDFNTEIDIRLLKDRSYLKFLDKAGVSLDDDAMRQVEDLLARVASTLVPLEVGTPPIPMDEAHEIERLRESLQRHHALGTRASIRYAFGLQFNPEIPAEDINTVLAYLRAFLLLNDWLEQRSQVALTRRVAPFINHFHQDYVRSVLAPDYDPTLAELIDHYIDHNPTRNRPLDMLPLLRHLDEERVDARFAGKDIKIKSRPTFHYRMPNSLIDDPDWTLAFEWAGWVAVDDLAQNRQQIARLSESYLADRSSLAIGYDEAWARQVAAWLDASR